MTEKTYEEDGSDNGNDAGDDRLTMNLLQDRIELASKISSMEEAMADENYTPSKMNDDVIPDVANEMNPGEVS